MAEAAWLTCWSQLVVFVGLTSIVEPTSSNSEVGKEIGAEVVANDTTRIRDLPAPLQAMMRNLQVGQATPPFGSPQEGVRVLVLCGRDDAPQTAGPSFDQVYAQLEEERVNRAARRYLRDLRRDAIVDYR